MSAEAQNSGVRIELLGRFRIAVGDNQVAADAWPGRRAAELVQLLALADRHRLTGDQVIEVADVGTDAHLGRPLS